MMQLGEAIDGPDAGGIIERGPEARVEQMTACRIPSSMHASNASSSPAPPISI